MTNIQRIGESGRWSDAVIFNNVARWVEVAADPSQDARSQIVQVLNQAAKTAEQIGTSTSQLLQATIFLTDLSNTPILNEIWDAWVPKGQAPVRACVAAGLQGNYMVEIIFEAAMC